MERRLFRAIILLVSSISIEMVESQSPFQPGNMDWMKMLQSYMNTTGMKGIPDIDEIIKRLDIQKLLESPMISSSINSSGIDPVLFNAFISSVSPRSLIRAVDIDRIILAYTSGTNKHIALTLIDSIDFNILMDSVNFTVFFSQPNVGKSLNKSGINPVLLKAFVTHVNMNKLVEAVNITQLVEVYVVRKNISKDEETKRILNDMNTDLLIDSVDWDAALKDQEIIEYLNQTGMTPLTIRLLRTAGVGKILKSMDTKAIVRDLVDGSLDTKDTTKFLTKYLITDKFIKNIKFGSVMQALLKGDKPLVITDLCSETFMDMTMPLPNLSNLDPSDPGILLAVKHPLLQRK